MTPANKPRMLKAALALALVLPVAWAGASLAVLELALAAPRRQPIRTPSDDQLAAERLSLRSVTDGTDIVGWYLKGGDERAVVLVHGMDSYGWAGAHIDLAKRYLSLGFTVVTVDLRGQGESGGSQLGLGYKERGDVGAAVKLLLERGFSPGSIGVHGTSYGAATALLSTAALPEVGAVIADSSFADFRDLIDVELERKVGAGSVLKPGIVFLADVVHGLDLNVVAPIVAVPTIAPRPIFFLHGSADERIPVQQTHRLRAAARGESDELWILEGAGHTQGINVAREEYLSRTTGFLARHLR